MINKCVSFCLLFLIGIFQQTKCVAQSVTEIQKFKVAEAKQAVAVDDHFFYVINNSTIGKFTKENGKLVTTWDGTSDRIKHLIAV